MRSHAPQRRRLMWILAQGNEDALEGIELLDESGERRRRGKEEEANNDDGAGVGGRRGCQGIERPAR